MTGALLMLDLVSQVQAFFNRKPVSLHGKTVQGQEQQQKNGKKSSHWSAYGRVSRL